MAPHGNQKEHIAHAKHTKVAKDVDTMTDFVVCVTFEVKMFRLGLGSARIFVVRKGMSDCIYFFWLN